MKHGLLPKQVFYMCLILMFTYYLHCIFACVIRYYNLEMQVGGVDQENWFNPRTTEGGYFFRANFSETLPYTSGLLTSTSFGE